MIALARWARRRMRIDGRWPWFAGPAAVAVILGVELARRMAV